jgi:hypothetical protein
MNSLTLCAPRMKATSAALALALAAAVSALNGCANYAGIKSDKQIAAAGNFQTSQSLPGEGAA